MTFVYLSRHLRASDRRSQRQSESPTLWCVADRCQAEHVNIQAAGSHSCLHCSSCAVSAARDGSAEPRDCWRA
eukprot:7669293-Prorocentrum_lima.AAC.1